MCDPHSHVERKGASSAQSQQAHIAQHKWGINANKRNDLNQDLGET